MYSVYKCVSDVLLLEKKIMRKGHNVQIVAVIISDNVQLAIALSV